MLEEAANGTRGAGCIQSCYEDQSGADKNGGSMLLCSETRGHTKGLEKVEQYSAYKCAIKSIFNKVTDDLIYIIHVKLIQPDYFFLVFL